MNDVKQRIPLIGEFDHPLSHIMVDQDIGLQLQNALVKLLDDNPADVPERGVQFVQDCLRTIAADVERLRITSPDLWEKQRTELEERISTHLWARGQLQGWFNAKGGITAKGKNASFEFVCGLATAFDMVDHYAKQWIVGQVFICAVRGTEARFPKMLPKNR